MTMAATSQRGCGMAPGPLTLGLEARVGEVGALGLGFADLELGFLILLDILRLLVPGPRLTRKSFFFSFFFLAVPILTDLYEMIQ